MAKPNQSLLSGIKLDDVDVEATLGKLAEGIQREAPHLKKGFRAVEKDVGDALKMLYDAAAGDDPEDEERDLLGKLFG